MLRPRDVLGRPGALVAVLCGWGGGLVALGLAFFSAFGRHQVSGCAEGLAVSPPLDLGFVLACTLSFLAGGLLTRAPGRARGPAGEGLFGLGPPRPGTVLQLILLLVLAMLTLMLAYEAWAVSINDANPQADVWPITLFVRCLSRLTSWTAIGSLAVACIVCAFCGKWLWYQPETRRR